MIIPAYLASGDIRETLDSVLGQTFLDLELILVNDGSPDTAELERVLQPYLTLPNFKYLRQENRGPSSARNTGVLAARGKYIAFLDSDDFWAPHYLAEQLRAVRENPSLDLIYADAALLEKDEPTHETFMQRSPSTGLVTFESLAREECTIITSTTVARRRALVEAGLFEEALWRCEDFHLWLRMAHAGARIAYQRKVLASHRVRNGLAADLVRMQEARVEVYNLVASRLVLSDAQRNLIRLQMETYQARLKLEYCKEELLSGKYREAFLTLRSANAFLKKRKFQWALFGVRTMPWLLRRVYPVYQRVIALALRRRTRNRSGVDARRSLVRE